MIADALSRESLPSGTQETELANVETESCRWYNKKIREVQEQPGEHPDFCIRDGRMYRHFFDRSDLREPDLADNWKLCVPTSQRQAVLHE